MRRVVVWTIAAWVIANLPLIYLLVSKRRRQLSRLWGYAPQQFLFLSVFFPFAACSTFIGLTCLGIAAHSTSGGLLYHVFNDYFSVLLTISAFITVLITVAIYFSSAMSLDKLRAPLADLAIGAIDIQASQTRSSSVPDVEVRSTVIRNRRQAKRENIPIGRSEPPEAVLVWLSKLPSREYLRMVLSPYLQRTLRMLDPTVRALNYVQFCAAFFVAVCGFAVVVLTVAASICKPNDTAAIPELSGAVEASLLLLGVFSLYPICYKQYRDQLETLVGPGFTVEQDWFSGVTILILLACVGVFAGDAPIISSARLVRVAPTAISAAVSWFAWRHPERMRHLIGSETKLGTQLIIVTLTLLFGVLLLIYLVSRLMPSS